MIDATRTGRQTKIPKDQRDHEVYVRINTKDEDKKYTGNTDMSSNERINEDYSRAMNPNHADYNRSVCKALRKHGKEAFQIKLLATVKGKLAAQYLEQCYINKFKTLDPQFGYNDKKAVSDKRMEELKLTIDLSTAKFFCPL